MADENINIQFNADTTSLREMRQEMKNLQIQMSETTDPTKFAALQKQFAMLRNDMADTSKAMKYLDPGEILSGWVKFGQGAVGAFGAITGAATLFGVENEKLQAIEKKSMILIQTMMGLEQARQLLIDGGGVKQLKILAQTTAAQLRQITVTNIATGAQAALNAVMNANPIMLIVTGIAALTAALIIFNKRQDEATEAVERYNAALNDRLNNSLKDSRKELEKVEIAHEKVNAQLKLQRGEMSQKEYDIYIANMERMAKLEELRVTILPKMVEAQMLYNEILQNGVITSKDKERYDKALENLNNYKSQFSEKTKEINDEYTLKVNEAIKKEEDYNKKKNEEIIKDDKETKNKLVKQQEDKTKAILDQMEKEKNAWLENQKLKESESQQADKDVEALIQRGIELENQKDKEIDQAQEIADKTLQIKKEQSEKEIQLQEETATKIKEIKDKEKQEDLEKFNATMDSATMLADSLMGLNDLVYLQKTKGLKKGSEEELKAAKKNFETSKKLNIVMTTISTIQGIVNALTAQSTVPEPFGQILKAANAVSVGVAGAVNIAKIRATSFDSSGSGGDTGSSPQVSSGSAPETFQPTQFIGLGQQVQTMAQPKPQRVYVLETDITRTQANVATIEERASYS